MDNLFPLKEKNLAFFNYNGFRWLLLVKKNNPFYCLLTSRNGNNFNCIINYKEKYVFSYFEGNLYKWVADSNFETIMDYVNDKKLFLMKIKTQKEEDSTENQIGFLKELGCQFVPWNKQDCYFAIIALLYTKKFDKYIYPQLQEYL